MEFCESYKIRGAEFTPLPKMFTNVVNPRNLDTYCFKYCILAKFVTRGDPQSPHSYTPELQDRYNWKNITFPVSLKDIIVFEKKKTIILL